MTLIPPHLSHPLRYKEFLEGAAGTSVIMDTLLEFCPGDRPARVIWAGYEESMEWSRGVDANLRARLKIGDHERVIVYTGNLHSANRAEVFSLYLAVALLNRHGIKTRLVRTGTDYVPLIDSAAKLEPVSDDLQAHCINLGHVPRQDLPSILSLADVLVQPGKADAFNAYRFPAKLPEFLATGKPVMLPATNIGRFLKDGEQCILLRDGNALEIAQKLETLFNDGALSERIGAAGRLFAERRLTWRQSAEDLRAFYQSTLSSRRVGRQPGRARCPHRLACARLLRDRLHHGQGRIKDGSEVVDQRIRTLASSGRCALQPHSDRFRPGGGHYPQGAPESGSHPRGNQRGPRTEAAPRP